MSRETGYKVFGVYEEVEISLIDVPDTRRVVDPAHVSVIQQSILRQGLINPITLYHPEGTPRYQLLAGAHRLVACTNLKLRHISARVYDSLLSDYHLKAIEVYENLHRKDLSDIEKAQQTSQLHQLMQQIHGPTVRGTGATGSGHSLQDTARILGKSVGSVHGDLKIARAIQELPELGLENATSKSDALRILQRFASVMGNREAASEMKETSLADSYKLGDFFAAELPEESFSFIECDPPYGIDLPSLRKAENKLSLEHDYEEVSFESYEAFMVNLCEKCFKLASPNSWMILWHGPQWYPTCVWALEGAGFSVCPVPAIWKKGNSPGQSQAPDSVLGNTYEQFLYARKGSPKLHQPGRGNIFDYAPVPPLRKIHPTERPVDLITDILRTFTWPETSVLCPFLGSGSTLLAASRMGLKCVGYDLSEHFKNAFVAKLLKEV